jgi:hypothetical protein
MSAPGIARSVQVKIFNIYRKMTQESCDVTRCHPKKRYIYGRLRHDPALLGTAIMNTKESVQMIMMDTMIGRKS